MNYKPINNKEKTMKVKLKQDYQHTDRLEIVHIIPIDEILEEKDGRWCYYSEKLNKIFRISAKKVESNPDYFQLIEDKPAKSCQLCANTKHNTDCIDNLECLKKDAHMCYMDGTWRSFTPRTCANCGTMPCKKRQPQGSYYPDCKHWQSIQDEYRPWTYEDRDKTRGLWLKCKLSEDEVAINDIRKDGIYVHNQYFYYNEIDKYYTLLNGERCGVKL